MIILFAKDSRLGSIYYAKGYKSFQFFLIVHIDDRTYTSFTRHRINQTVR